MAERDTIIKRVRKLLALGKGNASAGEATSAVLMAQRLIVKYGIATNGAYNSYITGFLSGLRSELEKQSRELMVVLPLEVAEKYEDEVASGLTSGKVRELSCDYRRHGLIEQGIRDGRDAVRSRRIEDTHDFALEG